LRIAQEHKDGPTPEHANELIDSLEAKGMDPTPEDDQDDGCWEDVDAGREDGDIEIS